MDFKYVAVDVDGTLLDDQKHYDKKRLAVDIKLLKDQGVTFIVATGNGKDAIDTYFPNGIVKNFVAENGGRIIVDGVEKTGHPHDFQTVAKIIDYSKELDVDLMSVSGTDQTYIPDRFSHVQFDYYPHYSFFHDLSEIGENVYNVNFNWHSKKLPLEKIMEFVRDINHNFDGVNATYSGAYGIDLLPAGVNKESGLKHYLAQTGGDLSQVVTIGDTSNDIEMVSAAGLGIAMKNATSDLKAVADQITEFDNNHNGVLNEIEKLFHLRPM
ncbi:MAG: HAD family hydrolase [Limosilactobacillus sp.]|uniref:HAD family hydrolase n=1 Tax=Limosilactobacillus sp. TaxID=2773925 RepID=UPI0027026AFB|nr:HAD family hydrolase [Limosilactobacillus sp.]